MLILAAAAQATALLSIPVPLSQDEAVEAPPCAFRVDAHPGDNVLESRLSVQSTAELVEASMSEGGEEVPAEMMGEFSRSSSEVLTVAWTDRSSEPEGDARSAFVRGFDEAALATEFEMSEDGMGGMEPFEEESEAESLVVSESVVFSFDGEEWTAAPSEDSELEQEDVERLKADLSLGFLSPGKEVDAGAEWDVPGDSLGGLLNPLGTLPFEDDGNGGAEGEGEPDGEDGGAPKFEGTLTARYVGLRDADGGTYCEVSLKGSLTSLDEYTEEIYLTMGDPDGGEADGDPIEQDIRTEGAYEVEGTALFDPVLGQFVRVSIEFTGQLENEMVMAFPDPMGADVEFENVEVEDVSTVFELSRKALGS